MAASHAWWSSLDYSEQLYDQAFGMIILNEDLHDSKTYQGYTIRPRTRANLESSGKSEVIDDEKQFKATLDVRDFALEELSARRLGYKIEVRGIHQRKPDAYGDVTREFMRKYALPTEVVPANVKAYLDNGILTIQGPKEKVEQATIEINVKTEEKVEIVESQKQDVGETMDDKSTIATS